MKIQTNLLHPIGTMKLWFFAIFWGGSVCLLGLMVSLYGYTQDIDTGNKALLERFTVLEEKYASINTASHEVPDSKVLGELKDRVSVINNITDRRGQSITEVLNKLETALPKDVYLLSFDHRLGQGETKLVAASNKVDGLTKLFMQLEEDNDFSEIMLSRQTRGKIRGEKIIQFELKLVEELI